MHLVECPHCSDKRLHTVVSRFCATTGNRLPSPPFGVKNELGQKMERALCVLDHERLKSILKQYGADKGTHYCEYCGQKVL